MIIPKKKKRTSVLYSFKNSSFPISSRVSPNKQMNEKKKVKLVKKKKKTKSTERHERKQITRMEFSQFQVGEWSNAKMPVGGRVAGKVGIYSSHYNGNVNRDIIPLRTTRTYNSLHAFYALIYVRSKGK